MIFVENQDMIYRTLHLFSSTWGGGVHFWIKSVCVQQSSVYDDSSISPERNLSSSDLPAPPALKLSVNETYVVDPGQDVTMSCEVTSGFPPPTVTWARYPGPLPRRATVRAGSLTLRSVTPAESGFYNCTAVNNVGNPARRNVNLIVRSTCTTLCIYGAWYRNVSRFIKYLLWLWVIECSSPVFNLSVYHLVFS